MSLSNNSTYSFSINTAGYDQATRLTVFDGNNRIQATGYGSVTIKLPIGLYMVRLERFGAMEEHLVIHKKGTDQEFIPPLRNSAMPSGDTKHTHEYYMGAGINFSTSSTVREPTDTTHLVRLMIMVRASGEQDLTGITLTSGLSLFTANGKRVTSFEPQETEHNDREGWLIFSGLLHPGAYLLVFAGPVRAEFLPILLYKGWDNLFFLPYEDRLHLTKASIHMVKKGRGFQPNDRLTQEIDGAMKGLGDRLDLLPDSLKMDAMYGKFEHPLVGLVGAHGHFLGNDRRNRLEQVVMQNLWRLLPSSPDVIALLIMALEQQNEFPDSLQGLQSAAVEAFNLSKAPNFQLDFPPVLRSGLSALVRASSRIPDLIKPDSWLEAAALSDFEGGGAWAVWDQDLDSVERVLQSPVDGKVEPSPHRIYSSIKRAIASRAGIKASHVRASDLMNNFFKKAAQNFPMVLRDMIADLGGLPMAAIPQVQTGDQVRDVMEKVREAARISQVRTTGITPEINLPDWLIEFTGEALEDREQPPDIRVLSLKAGVPLRQVQEAIDLIQKRDSGRHS